jgi:hypothetical protein
MKIATRTSYIKHNSQARKHAQHSVNTTIAVCNNLGITTDEWLAIFFEAGCQYAELRAPTAQYAQEWLTDEALGFWATWMSIYTSDDEWMLKHKINDKQQYIDLKMKFNNESSHR